MKSSNSPNMVVIALNEASRYFIDKFIEQGHLPNFARLLQQGRFITTYLKDMDVHEEFSPPITPWLVWPSVYTGLLPKLHGIHAYGQQGFNFSEQTIWSELTKLGISSGLMGIPLNECLFPHPLLQFYLPEPLSNSSHQQSVIPKQYQTIQDLLLFTSQIYSKNYLSYCIKLFYKLSRVGLNKIPYSTLWKLLKQILAYALTPKKYCQSMLWHANLQMTIFNYLLQYYKPQFSLCHLDYLAAVQLRYWRALEPEKFSENLSEIDKCFYTNRDERLKYEFNFKDAILESFSLADHWIGEQMSLMDSHANSVLVVMSGLGQQQHDPGSDPNPTLAYHNISKLMQFADIHDYHLVDDKRSDLTLNFKSESEAQLAKYKLSEIKLLAKATFFRIQQVKHQLFLEANLSPEIWTVGNAAWLENEATGKIARLFDFVYFSNNMDQQNAERNTQGWIMLYGDLSAYSDKIQHLEVTKIKDFLIQFFTKYGYNNKI